MKTEKDSLGYNNQLFEAKYDSQQPKGTNLTQAQDLMLRGGSSKKAELSPGKPPTSKSGPGWKG